MKLDIYDIRKMQNSLKLDISTVMLPDSFTDDLLSKPAVQGVYRDDDQGGLLASFTEDDWKYYIAYYHYLVKKVDNELGRILEKLREMAQLDNTLIIFSSDQSKLDFRLTTVPGTPRFMSNLV